MAVGWGQSPITDNSYLNPWQIEKRKKPEPSLPEVRTNQRVITVGENIKTRLPHAVDGKEHKGNLKVVSVGEEAAGPIIAECVMRCGLIVRVIPVR